MIWDVRVRKNEVILDMNGVAVARHGLILWENEATGFRIDLKYLPGSGIRFFILKLQWRDGGTGIPRQDP